MNGSEELERRNLGEIERLNQRGGRTLSIVDLVDDGTLTPEMASLIAVMVEAGSSFLTGAVPGGAGKTTLMASMLSFLPDGEPIVTVSDSSVIRSAARSGGPATVMPHEIGAGRWYGYIWGGDVVDFFALREVGLRRVSCLHADDPRQTEAALRDLGVREADWWAVKMLAYMAVRSSGHRPKRRVSGLYGRLDGRLGQLFEWLPADDAFRTAVPREQADRLVAAEFGLSAERVGRRRAAVEALIEGLRAEDVRDYAGVRRRIVRQRRA